MSKDTNENKELKREFESPEVEEFLREMQKKVFHKKIRITTFKTKDENKENNSEETERKIVHHWNYLIQKNFTKRRKSIIGRKQHRK